MNAHTRPAAPNMHNFTNDYLADEIGQQDAIAKAATARLNALKEEAKRRGIEIAQGSHYRISVDTGERKTLDTKALCELLGKDALEPYYRTTPTCTLRISSVFQQPEVVG
jgi:hypothetical protein